MTAHHRPARALAWMDDARRDLRHAVRSFAKAPGFTFVAVLTLALGIGAVTIIYSVIHDVLLDPLPYPNSDRLVNVMVVDTQTGRTRSAFPALEFLDFRDQSRVFDDVIGTLGQGMMLSTPDRAEFLRAVWVTPNFFDFMGLRPQLGRAITADDGKPDAPPVAVLRHRAWVSYFGGDPHVIGTTMLLNGEPRTIVGVMPPRFTWHAADVWIPKAVDTSASPSPNAVRQFQARLKRGVTIEQAEAELTVIASRRAREHPTEYPANLQVRVVNVIAFTVGAFSGVLYTTLAAVALLMLIACCNVANMLLARATVREREMTVRAALGAGRGRIVRQLLVESLVLSLAGAVAGCFLAYIGIGALVPLLPEGPLPGEVDFALDGAALAFSLGTAIVSAMLFGTAPAFYAARRDLVEGLKSAGRGIAGGRGRLRNALVTAEIALSLVLLLGAGLLMRTFVSLVRVDLGFDAANTLVLPVFFPPDQQGTPAEKHRFYQEALQRISSLPGVQSAAATTTIPPFFGGLPSELELPGRPRVSGATASVQLCTDQYFATLGIRLLRGRLLPDATVDRVPRVAVVNQTFVTQYFAADDPLGKPIRLTFGGKESDPAQHGVFEIVGVVQDVRNQGIRDALVPHVYLPGATTARANPFIVARTTVNPNSLVNAARAEIAIVDRRVAVRQAGALEDMLHRSFYAQPRFSLVVFALFAVTGTLLVGIGVFSVLAYTVSRQTTEIAVRMALGAGHGDVLGVVFRLGAQLVAAGIAVGLLASFATNRLIANQLWNTSPQDPLTIAAAIGTIIAVASAACGLPALRAMRVDPMAALRRD